MVRFIILLVAVTLIVAFVGYYELRPAALMAVTIDSHDPILKHAVVVETQKSHTTTFEPGKATARADDQLIVVVKYKKDDPSHDGVGAYEVSFICDTQEGRFLKVASQGDALFASLDGEACGVSSQYIKW